MAYVRHVKTEGQNISTRLRLVVNINNITFDLIIFFVIRGTVCRHVNKKIVLL